jgi:hypothetical protein
LVDLVVEHINQSFGTSATAFPKLTNGLKAKLILFRNTSNNILYISFDNKTNYRQVAATSDLLLQVGGNEWIKIKKGQTFAYGAAANTTVEVIMLIPEEYSTQKE